MPRPSNDPPNELEIFLDAPADEAAREAYLDSACGGDAALRARVEALIAAERQDSGVMDRRPLPTGGLASGGLVAEPEAAGTLIGNYRLCDEIGRGGFGVVYHAEQLRPVARPVALKIIKLGMDTRQVVARFEAERQALAMMDHPAIAKVHDAGATDSGRPYFVMELVDGVPITEFCEAHQLDLRRRLELFIEVCRAVQHAHLKGIIHRDLKPSNILVAMHDGKPCPKVIDFGVAKATEQDLGGQTIHTREEQVIGTPAYMSPEQAQRGGIDIDSRSDVYSLGVLLYELLTRTTPFDGKELARASQDRLKRIIQEVDPPRPSSRIRLRCTTTDPGDAAPSAPAPSPFSERSLRGELDWIVMKALEKDRARRYETANSLAQDLQRFLDHEPVSAAAPSMRYRLSKYVRRHRAGLAVAAAIVVLLVTGSLLSLWQARQATTARDEATAAKEKATRGEWIARHEAIDGLFDSGKGDLAIANLAKMLREDSNDRVAANRVLSALTQRNLPRRMLPPLRAGNAGYFRAEYSPDGSVIATGDWGGTLQIWDARTGERVGPPMKGRPTILDLVFSPDGNLIAAQHEIGLEVWEWRTGTAKVRLDYVDPMLATFSPDSKLLLTRNAFDQSTRNYINSARIVRLDEADRNGDFYLGKHGDSVTTGCFSPDGRFVVTGSFDGTVRVWDLARALAGESSAVGGPMQHEGIIWSATFSGDGRRLVTATQAGTAHVWAMPTAESDPAETPREIMRTARKSARIISAEFSPDPEGKRVLTACFDGTASVWDTTAARPLANGDREMALISEFSRSASPLWQAKYGPDGKRVLTASNDGTGQLWHAATGQPSGEPLRHEGPVERASFHPDGAEVLTVGADGVAKVWEARPGQPHSLVFYHRGVLNSIYESGKVGSAGCSPDGTLLVTAGTEKRGRLWDLRKGRLTATLPHDEFISSTGFSPDGNWVFTTSNNLVIAGTRLWQVGPSQPSVPSRLKFDQYASGPTRFAEISPDSRWLATGSDDGIARVWRVGQTDQPRAVFQHETRVTRIRFDPHPDRDRIVTGCNDGFVAIWDAGKNGNDQEPLVLAGHDEQISEILFRKDGSRLATASWDGTVGLWDPVTGRQVMQFDLSTPVRAIDFSPDGTLLAVAGSDGTGRIWNVDTGHEHGRPLRHSAAINMIRFSPDPDDRRVVTASSDWTARVWDLDSGLPLSEPLRHQGACFHALFTPDGNQVVTTGDDLTARAWDIPQLDLPAPAWLPDWAEEAVGMGLKQNGTPSQLPWAGHVKVRKAGRARSGNDPYAKAIRWFYAPVSKRPLSPFRDYTLEDYLHAATEHSSPASRREAARVSP